MLTSAECRANAEAKLAQADRDARNRKRLIIAAESWLILASDMRRLEIQQGSPDGGRKPKASRISKAKYELPAEPG
jgi:hypothetical protein